MSSTLIDEVRVRLLACSERPNLRSVLLRTSPDQKASNADSAKSISTQELSSVMNRELDDDHDVLPSLKDSNTH